MPELRRKEYRESNQELALAFLDSATHGYLSFVRPDGTPGIVALNFARVGSVIYFHGALEGEKVRSLAAEPRVALMVTEVLAISPSYFRAPERACPATQYYRAVVVRGVARAVESREDKAAALQALMEKLQPEGGHRPITAGDPLYRKSIDTTGVFAIAIEEVTAKFKLGQGLPGRVRASVAAQLTARDAPGDAATVAAMASARPFA